MGGFFSSQFLNWVRGSNKAFINKKSISFDGHVHSANDINTGTLSVSRGGTGQTSINGLKSALGITNVSAPVLVRTQDNVAVKTTTNSSAPIVTANNIWNISIDSFPRFASSLVLVGWLTSGQYTISGTCRSTVSNGMGYIIPRFSISLYGFTNVPSYYVDNPNNTRYACWPTQTTEWTETVVSTNNAVTQAYNRKAYVVLGLRQFNFLENRYPWDYNQVFLNTTSISFTAFYFLANLGFKGEGSYTGYSTTKTSVSMNSVTHLEIYAV